MNAADVLGANVLSPEYDAVTLIEPLLSKVQGNTAVPPLKATTIDGLPLKSKVTVPVGVPLGPVTVAVRVTASPAPAGFSDDESVVVLGRAEALPCPQLKVSAPRAAITSKL